VLVATTVIEVGVDVPNATVMIIEDADRFGLAQLHQLRGRVGRGTLAGHVCLVSGSKAPTALKRLSAMENISDGFSLAEYDLSLRREGDILGNRQHGASSLKLVNIARDARMIEAAHDDAQAIIDADPDLSDADHRALRHEVEMIFGSPGKEIS
jgi:ATP-dependent DNA helicase RecG